MESWSTVVPYLNSAAPYLIAAAISMLIALAEIITVFENDALRALKTWGSLLLVFLSAAFAAFLLAAVPSLGRGGTGDNRIWVTLGVGLRLSTVLRTDLTFIKP